MFPNKILLEQLLERNVFEQNVFEQTVFCPKPDERLKWHYRLKKGLSHSLLVPFVKTRNEFEWFTISGFRPPPHPANFCCFRYYMHYINNWNLPLSISALNTTLLWSFEMNPVWQSKSNCNSILKIVYPHNKWLLVKIIVLGVKVTYTQL
jgi:hypothetical protein